MTPFPEIDAWLRPMLSLPRIGFIVWRHGVLPLGFETLRSIYREGIDDLKLRQVGDALVRILQHAGPTYVKIGRILSTRDDLLPQILCERLTALFDESLPRMSRDEVTNQLHLAYPSGVPFLDIEAEPLGVGSIAQVHRAKLPDGRPVVLKILRPNVEEFIRRDIEAAKLIVSLIFRGLSERAREWLYPTLKLLDDLGVDFLEDANLVGEAKTLQEFREKLKGSTTVYVPEVFPEYSNREVLVLEEIQGFPLSELRHKGAQAPELAKRAAGLALREIIKQILDVGVFHPDPHGGNLLLMSDGRLALIDVAQAGRFSPLSRARLIRLMQAIILADPAQITEALRAFGELPVNFDQAGFEAELRATVETAEGLGRRTGQVLAVASKYRITMTPETVDLVRSLVMVEALGRRLDPEFKAARVALPQLLRSVGPSLVPTFLKKVFRR